MSTFLTGEKAHQAVLPQRPALELTSADKAGVAPKRGVSAATQVAATGQEHDRGETPPLHLAAGRHHGTGEHSGAGEPGSDAGTTAPTSTGPIVSTSPRVTAPSVAVLDRDGQPLMPCHPARARELLAKGRAVVAHLSPFVIRLKDRSVADSVVDGVQVGIDPGSRHTGIAVFGFGVTTGQARRGLFTVQIDHRGRQINANLTGRAQLRRGRRGRDLRYRAPRFSNRTRPKGWLAPSLAHRVHSTMSWTEKLTRWFPVTGWHQELVRFDMQQLRNPEISGVQYQQGTLAGFEVREYLLAKWGRKCAYCSATGVGPTGIPLNIDHIHPKARGGGNAVSNLTLACIGCNLRKDARDVRDFVTDPARLARILAQAKRPLADAAAVNSTRWALHQALTATGLPVATGSGGQTKFNRTRYGLPKSHTLDALAVGRTTGIASWPRQLHLATSTGRGSYARTRSDRFGFPRLHLTRVKQHFGFATGDLVTATVTTGGKAGRYTGRVAVRATGKFNITTTSGTVQSIHHRFFTLSQRADGWNHTHRKENSAESKRVIATHDALPSRPEGRGIRALQPHDAPAHINQAGGGRR